MSGFKIINNNTANVLKALSQQTTNALEICGGKAETYAKRKCPVDTGVLRNSITHLVDADQGKCYIGTNVEYAPYVEFGTGVHYLGGRKTPWTYQDAKGKWHMTNGSKAQPFIKPAVTEHSAEYLSITKFSLNS